MVTKKEKKEDKVFKKPEIRILYQHTNVDIFVDNKYYHFSNLKDSVYALSVLFTDIGFEVKDK